MIFQPSDIHKLKRFLSEQGRIFPQRITGLKTKKQRQIKKIIKQARILGFFSFTKKKQKTTK